MTLAVKQARKEGEKKTNKETFIDIRRQATDKDLPGVTFNPLAILAACGRAHARSQRLVTVSFVQEAIFKGEEGRTAWTEGREERRWGRERKTRKKDDQIEERGKEGWGGSQKEEKRGRLRKRVSEKGRNIMLNG